MGYIMSAQAEQGVLLLIILALTTILLIVAAVITATIMHFGWPRKLPHYEEPSKDVKEGQGTQDQTLDQQ